MRRHWLSLGAFVAVAALFIVLGPAYLRSGLSALLVWRSAEASTPYKIEVQPGDARVPRGGDQAIHAKLVGFASKDVSLMMRATPGGNYRFFETLFNNAFPPSQGDLFAALELDQLGKPDADELST